jgi:hypothetical protein
MQERVKWIFDCLGSGKGEGDASIKMDRGNVFVTEDSLLSRLFDVVFNF